MRGPGWECLRGHKLCDGQKEEDRTRSCIGLRPSKLNQGSCCGHGKRDESGKEGHWNLKAPLVKPLMWNSLLNSIADNENNAPYQQSTCTLCSPSCCPPMGFVRCTYLCAHLCNQNPQGKRFLTLRANFEYTTTPVF